MKTVEPQIFLVGETKIHYPGLKEFFAHIGVTDWTTDATTDIE